MTDSLCLCNRGNGGRFSGGLERNAGRAADPNRDVDLSTDELERTSCAWMVASEAASGLRNSDSMRCREALEAKENSQSMLLPYTPGTLAIRLDWRSKPNACRLAIVMIIFLLTFDA